MKKRFLFGLVCVLVAVSGAWAGGWNNTLMGVRAIAMGGAFAGLADDPSAVYYNPAGLVQQKNKLSLSLDGFYVKPVHSYTMPNGSTAHSRLSNSIPQIFLSYRMNERITIGFGAYIPYAGGGINWKTSELGYLFKSSLGVISLSPCLAYKVSDQFSMGFSINYYLGVTDLNADIPGSGPIKSDESGSAESGSFSMMFKPAENFRIGLSVRGPARMRLSGKTSLSVAAPELGQITLKLDSETRFNLPWDFELGVSYRISKKLILSSSAQYTMWHALDKVQKVIKSVPLMGNLQTDEIMDFKDILIMRVGFEYMISSRLALRGGVGLDRYATPDKALNFMNIDVDKFTLLGGFGYRANNIRFDFVYIHAAGREREVQHVFSGVPVLEKYNLSASIIGVGVSMFF